MTPHPVPPNIVGGSKVAQEAIGWSLRWFIIRKEISVAFDREIFPFAPLVPGSVVIADVVQASAMESKEGGRCGYTTIAIDSDTLLQTDTCVDGNGTNLGTRFPLTVLSNQRSHWQVLRSRDVTTA